MDNLPSEQDTLKRDPAMSNDEVEVVVDEGLELEVIDDTPPEDRNRKPVPPEEAEPTEEEMEQYSEAVKRRISKMKHSLHDERRSKEAAARERDAAIAYAKQAMAEKKAIEDRFTVGEEAFIAQTKEKVDMTMAEAKRAYKNAYEIGDADAMADAQEKISAAALERQRADDWAKGAAQRKQNAGQQQNSMLQSDQSSQVAAPEQDPDASEWASKNRWFGQNKVMTGAAYGVHDELVSEGIDPGVDPKTYYKELNARMREAFPNHEWGDAPKRKTTSVVAPVNRTSKTATRVTLTQSQVAVARRMGITPLQYAIELAKLEK
jgi:hypothetical protein